jgi:adenosine deaminase
LVRHDALMTALDPTAVARLPKVELHCHIEGTMRATTARELAAEHGIALPVGDPTDLYRYDDLTGFLEVFWLIQSLLADAPSWERLAYESAVDGAPHGLIYREAFFTPARHLAAGQSLADIVGALDAGLAAAERETGVVTRLIFDIDRAFGPAAGVEHVRELARLRGSGAPGADRVIGVGMDSTELGIDPATFLEAYRLAAGAGLRLTAHQGENSPAAAIATAVDVLGCERIDHGISIVEDAELAARLADRRLPFTVCPNANVRINPDVCAELADHPLRAMRDAGLLVTLNTDDPALTGLDLTEEYVRSAAAFALGWDELVELAFAAVDASWADDRAKAAMGARVRAGARAALTEPVPS